MISQGVDVKVMGGLGSQVLMYAYAMINWEGKLVETHYPNLNTGPTHRLMNPESTGKAHIENILDIKFPLIPRSMCTNVTKSPNHVTNAMINTVVLNRDYFLSLCSPKPAKSFDEVLLHFRGWDSRMLSEQDVKKTVEKFKCSKIITDDVHFCKENFNIPVNEESQEQEWLRLTNSKTICYAAPSMFTLMAAYVNPYLQLNLISNTSATPAFGGRSHKVRYSKQANKFVQSLDNVNWVKI